MKPEGISEKMMFNTVKISTKTGCGTGSYFNFKVGEYVVPTIITNKHVVNNNTNELTTFAVHLEDDFGNPSGNLNITYNTSWIFHPTKDICFCYANPLFEQVYKRHGKKVYYIGNDESIVYAQEKLNELTALEELVMVGYPIGLCDIRNNYPIFRKGYTASHPAIDFNEEGVGLIDMACLPGSSGSPIYILNEGGYRDKKGNTFLGQSRIILIVFLCSGPCYTAEGDVIVKSIPTSKVSITTNTPIMANLGYYIKAKEILVFKEVITNQLNPNNH